MEQRLYLIGLHFSIYIPLKGIIKLHLEWLFTLNSFVKHKGSSNYTDAPKCCTNGWGSKFGWSRGAGWSGKMKHTLTLF